MAKGDLKQPNIKGRVASSIDSLLGLGDEFGLTTLELTSLVPFEGHPFALYQGERMDDLVASIQANGVIQPILVRKKGENVYEILSGHNRTEASKIAGLKEIPAVVLEDVADDKALAYVVETNLMQRSFSDMRHTEKAAVIALHHSKMFSPGKRNDILAELAALEATGQGVGDTAPGSDGDYRKHSDKIVAEMYSLSGSMVSRYLRVQYLSDSLKKMLDDNVFGIRIAVLLSFISEDCQNMIAECMVRDSLAIDVKKATALRAYFDEHNGLDNVTIYKILTGAMTPKAVFKPTVKVDPTVYAKYFNPQQDKTEIEEIIAASLELFFEKYPDRIAGVDEV